MRRKWVWVWPLLLVLAVGVLVAANILRHNSGTTVTVAIAERGVVSESVFASGRFHPAGEHAVFAEAAGRVAEVHVREGDVVKAGDKLMTYDTSEWEKQLAETREQLEIAAISREQERRRSFDAVRGQTDGEKVERALQEEKEAQRLHELRTAAAERTIAELERLIREAVVAAPADGVVAAVVPAPGARLSPGMETFRIADVERLVVKASLSELDAGKVRPGMKAIVTGDAFDAEFEGELVHVSPVAQPAGADGFDYTVAIEVSLPAGAVPPETAKPGFAATLEFRLEGEEHVLVPIGAIRYTGAEASVFRVEDGVVSRVPVTPGRDDGERMEVLAGLDEGDVVVHPVPAGLADGDEVKAELPGRKAEQTEAAAERQGEGAE